MQITVNGEALELEENASVAQLVAKLLPGKDKIAVELNKEIVPRSEYASRMLATGDELEIVHAIGGG